MDERRPRLSVKNLEKVYYTSRRFSNRRGRIIAVKNVSFDLYGDEILGLGGASGSGKTTMARCIAGCERPSGGVVLYNDTDVSAIGKKDIFNLRKKIQMIWQDPRNYLNPYMTVENIIKEPIDNYRAVAEKEKKRCVIELMRCVELDAALGGRRPHELSGGQCQRVAIARALAVEPELLICDEILNNLDVSLKIKILDLLLKLHKELQLACIFITHDMSQIRYLCSEVIVMDAGEIVMRGRLRKSG